VTAEFTDIKREMGGGIKTFLLAILKYFSTRTSDITYIFSQHSHLLLAIVGIKARDQAIIL